MDIINYFVVSPDNENFANLPIRSLVLFPSFYSHHFNFIDTGYSSGIIQVVKMTLPLEPVFSDIMVSIASQNQIF